MERSFNARTTRRERPIGVPDHRQVYDSSTVAQLRPTAFPPDTWDPCERVVLWLTATFRSVC
jgi:hypothetical protein